MDIDKALNAFKITHGHLNIPESYIVPNRTLTGNGLEQSLLRCPKCMIGAPLGKILRDIKEMRLYFDDINFPRWKSLRIHFVVTVYKYTCKTYRDNDKIHRYRRKSRK